MSLNVAALALFVVLAAWLFCLAASVLHWHSDITGPCTGVLVVPLVACWIWFKRAGKNDGGRG